jgi:hypothetical protein
VTEDVTTKKDGAQHEHGLMFQSVNIGSLSMKLPNIDVLKCMSF